MKRDFTIDAFDRDQVRSFLLDAESILEQLGGSFLISAMRTVDAETGEGETFAYKARWDSFTPAVQPVDTEQPETSATDED